MNEVLAIYFVKYYDKYVAIDFTKENINNLKDIFWNFNIIEKEIISNEDGTLLKINVKSKSKEEIMELYNFSDIQKENVEELLSEKYKNLWNDLLYKMSINNFKIVELAKKQVGNVGGERYWKWYGFESRVEWCAIFISWLANQIGVLGTSIPKFSNVGDGIKWYKQRGLWREHNYIAKTGDIIFFDWDNDGKANHVGVVEKVENNMIYTIEGNSNNDRCSEKRYDITSSFILGYGLVL